MSLFEININNSFNKGKSNLNKEGALANNSTLNNNLDNSIEINSINTPSLTGSVVNSQFGPFTGDDKRKTLIREVFIGATGTVLGSLITYAIMNFLR